MDRSTAALALAAVPALAVLSPSGAGATAPLVTAVAVAAWTATAWLLVVAALTWGSRGPGAVGRLADRLVRRVAPPSVRVLVRVAVGASVTASVLAGPAALAEEHPPTVAGSATDSLDWPGLAPLTASPPSPAGSAPVATAVRPTAAPVQDGPVVVRAGDSLWSLAAQQLGPEATDRQIAQAWPRWWSANRAVVGDDPDLIHPGDRLTAP